MEYLTLLFGAAASTDDAAARHMIPIALVAGKAPCICAWKEFRPDR
jgi:hypothetical protein